MSTKYIYVVCAVIWVATLTINILGKNYPAALGSGFAIWMCLLHTIALSELDELRTRK